MGDDVQKFPVDQVDPEELAKVMNAPGPLIPGTDDANEFKRTFPSNLVAHAKRELELLGEEPETIEWYLKVIQAFADFGHSGGSAAVTIPVINALLQYKNLKPLTDDPNEWIHHSEEVWGSPGGVWQSCRNSEAFSNDGGKTYYLLSDGAHDQNREPLYQSVIVGEGQSD